MNMNKTRFGTKEIIASVVGTMLFAGIRILEDYLFSKGIIQPEIAVWIGLGVPVLAAVALFFGPVCSVLCAIGGELISRAILGTSVRYLELFTLGLYGLLIGVFFGKLHNRNYRFGIRDVIDFNVIQMLAGIICGMFILPLGQFMIDGRGINEAIVIGGKKTVGISVTVGVILSVAMFIVSLVTSGRKYRDT